MEPILRRRAPYDFEDADAFLGEDDDACADPRGHRWLVAIGDDGEAPCFCGRCGADGDR